MILQESKLNRKIRNFKKFNSKLKPKNNYFWMDQIRTAQLAHTYYA